MQALAFRAGSFQFDCVAEAEQRPRQSELVGGSIKKPRRLAEQCAFCGEVSDTVSQGMDGPAGTDAIAERPTNRDTLLSHPPGAVRFALGDRQLGGRK